MAAVKKKGKTVEFVNNTDVVVKFYFESPSENYSLRFTLHPNGKQTERVGVSNTYGKLRLSDEEGNMTDDYVSTDEMDEFKRITITKDEVGKFVVSKERRCRSAKKIPIPRPPTGGSSPSASSPPGLLSASSSTNSRSSSSRGFLSSLSQLWSHSFKRGDKSLEIP